MYALTTIVMIMLVYCIQGVERQISARWFTTETSMLPENPKSSYETSPRDSQRVHRTVASYYILDNLYFTWRSQLWSIFDSIVLCDCLIRW